MCSLNGNCSTIQKYQDKMDAVFGNDLVLEIILTFAIKGETKKICRKTLCSVRLVQKLWLKTISRLIQKFECHSPYYILLGENNSLNQSTNVKAKGKILDQFISTFTANNHLQISIIPGHVSLGVHFFQAENYDSLFKYFTQCGQHLKDLNIEFPLDGGSMPLSFPQFNLPSLQRVSFNFTNEICENRKEDERNEVFGDNRNGLAFLQLILNASPKLKYFVLFGLSSNCVPAHFEYIQLPDTVLGIDLESDFTIQLKEFMLRQNLPILTNLKLTQQVSNAGETRVFNVLEHFKKTLKCVSLSGINTHFPLMDSLEELRCLYSVIKMDNSRVTMSPQILPKLKKVAIGADAELWSKNFEVFTTVDKFELTLVKGYKAKYSIFKVMERFHISFPNLQRLSIGLTMKTVSSLNYVVTHMNQLKKLKIKIYGKVIRNSQKQFESVLLGHPGKNTRPGLLNLSELHTLSLYSENGLEDGESSLLTSSIFQLGLQQMVNLRKLMLIGVFKPTTEMQENWGSQGKYMEYSEKGMWFDEGL